MKPRRGTLLGPDSVEVFARRLKAGDVWHQTLAITGYPREVSPGWLTPLLTYPGRVDVALHVEPVANEVAVRRLRRQSARFESTRQIDSTRGKLADPEIEAAAEDAKRLMSGVARGEGRLFRVGLYITVSAATVEALDAEVERVRSICGSMLLDARAVAFRSLQGWISTLALGLDAVRLRRTFDSRALAACFPFASSEIGGTDGILLGRNAVTGSLMFLDRFDLENHNQVILAHSGKGKSFLAKLQVLRSLYQGIEVLVVDPENEYERLALAVGGSVIRLGMQDGRLNPLDLAEAGSPDALTRQSQFVQTLVDTMLDGLPQGQRAELDRAVLAAYDRAGITLDVRTHGRAAPLLNDVVEALKRDGAEGLANRLEPFVKGSSRGLFDGPTGVSPVGHLVVFSLKDVPAELKGPATLMALETIWRTVSRGETKRRIVVVDEAWLLLQTDSGAKFLERLARSSRKYLCGLTTITQDVRDALSTNIGHTIITNAASQVILGQHPQAIEALAEAFGLSKGERSYLVACPQGQGLLCLGTERAPLRIVASESEYALVNSDPVERVISDGEAS